MSGSGGRTRVLGPYAHLSWVREAAAAKSLQSCPTLCDPIGGSPPGFPVPGILQARILEWVAISFSNAWKWKVNVKSLSRVRLLATSWTAAYQAPPSMGFSRQEYWSGVPLPSPTEASMWQHFSSAVSPDSLTVWVAILCLYQIWDLILQLVTELAEFCVFSCCQCLSAEVCQIFLGVGWYEPSITEPKYW